MNHSYFIYTLVAKLIWNERLFILHYHNILKAEKFVNISVVFAISTVVWIAFFEDDLELLGLN